MESGYPRVYPCSCLATEQQHTTFLSLTRVHFAPQYNKDGSKKKPSKPITVLIHNGDASIYGFGPNGKVSKKSGKVCLIKLGVVCPCHSRSIMIHQGGTQAGRARPTTGTHAPADDEEPRIVHESPEVTAAVDKAFTEVKKHCVCPAHSKDGRETHCFQKDGKCYIITLSQMHWWGTAMVSFAM